MKLEDFQLLLALKRYGTIHATAKKVLISQPAVTQRLKYIEAYFGSALFLRTPKKLIPTPSGELVLKHADFMIQSEKKIHEKLAAARGEIAGTVSIGASSLFSQYFLAGQLQSFMNKYPDVSIDLVTGTSEEIRQTAEDFHICIVRGDPIPGYEIHHLFHDRLYLFDSLPFERMEGRPFIEFKSDQGFQILLDKWLAENPGIKRSFKVDQFETAKQMMKRGIGATVLPESIIKNEKDYYHHKPLMVGGEIAARETWACTKENMSELPQVRAYIEHLHIFFKDS
ncbi:LysR family transcriptional regulator [Halobacillus sp. BAB-2008]|uniref:LysR family transcriptional regulator n=1 Tax=Halobacillus sp. BAB-2008 TaxID=1246484 RepID=UPI0002A5083D|nr:LysR family transcriptional regulator [Halobacillus sp. BAB-2008]ELK46279.1 LysR family transcriptional regulator [Halobacillus sp. BAB-2008]